MCTAWCTAKPNAQASAKTSAAIISRLRMLIAIVQILPQARWLYQGSGIFSNPHPRWSADITVEMGRRTRQALRRMFQFSHAIRAHLQAGAFLRWQTPPGEIGDPPAWQKLLDLGRRLVPRRRRCPKFAPAVLPCDHDVNRVGVSLPHISQILVVAVEQYSRPLEPAVICNTNSWAGT